MRCVPVKIPVIRKEKSKELSEIRRYNHCKDGAEIEGTILPSGLAPFHFVKRKGEKRK